MERKKVRCAIDHNFDALLCIGETEEEKDSKRSDEILENQLRIGLKDVKIEETDKIWIAYEPVWAIGVNGKPITIEYADDKIHVIRNILVDIFEDKGEDIPIFYGGSVNPDNAIDLATKCTDINGLFIGRSAWEADKFDKLIREVLSTRA